MPGDALELEGVGNPALPSDRVDPRSGRVSTDTIPGEGGLETVASGSEKGQGPSEGAVPFRRDYTAAREMIIRAGRYARRARDLSVVLDFSDASIGVAEEFGLELWAMLPGGLSDDKAEELRGRLIFDLGAYFGETLIRNHGGRWGWATIDGRRVFALRTNSGVIVFPLRKARTILRGEEPGTLVALYQFLSR